MAIKRVSAIPNAYKNGLSTREKVRKDLEFALTARISMFEFEGDYNYKTLGSYVRDEADRLFRDRYWSPARDEIVNTLGKELGRTDIECERIYREYKQAFKIHGVTQSDRIHIYVEIDFNYLDNYKSSLMARTRIQCGLSGNRKGTG